MTWLTTDLQGSGGVLHADPNDFIVEEIPSYLPSGEGEHLMMRIEKIGLTTPEALRRLATALELHPRDLGTAGMKDKNARARQWVSAPWPVKKALPDLSRLESPDLRVLEADRHGNKLKRGHQRGNRFEITVRGVAPGGLDRARAILEALRARGVPNAFGPQRFGARGDNADQALAILRKEERPPRDRRILGLLFSALQSKVFNRTLALRIERGLFTTALAGDVMQKHDTHGLFDCVDASADQPRVEALQISPTGPLPGPQMRPAHGVPHELELAALADCRLTGDDVSRLDAGTRRVLRYPLDPEARLSPIDPDAYRLEVTLPSGAFATVLLGELIKPESGVVLREEDAA
ncbi:MAG: tRNA pseudouridine(13) synthase TruD [Deltaproteobacteria bacterium]|nr:tRNA pseudouridine(13) synthase TruD [Deltaproteobacteria bacterium]